MSGMIAFEDSVFATLPLRPSFYRRDTIEVARALLGCRLVRRLPRGGTRSVVIVETEAYLGVIDRAAHTWKGRRTARVLPMWGPGGHAYVYQIYGMHFCLNVVTQKEGTPEAVLIRAGVPEEWWLRKEEKENRSSKVSAGPPFLSKQNLLRASGPGRLCRYLEIDSRLSGVSLCGPELMLSRGPRRRFLVLSGPRVGVANAGDAASWPLRFAVAECPAVTRRKDLRPA
jgi:DNA-3-methyladenine glycosylase